MDAYRIPLSRLWITAVIAVGLIALLACGSTEEATPTPTATATVAAPVTAATPTPEPMMTDEPVYGGTARIADRIRPQSFELTHLGGGLQPANGIGPIVWSALVRESIVDRVSIEGDLAESWDVSDDGTEWTFQIREGIVDHNGDPYGAEEIAYLVHRMVDRPNDAPYSQGGGCMKTAIKEPTSDGGVEVTGPNEVTIRLKGPTSWFAACVSSGYVMFGPAKQYKAIDDTGEWRLLDPEKDEIIGTGPFKAVNLVEEVEAVYEKNERYFKEGRPFLDRVEIFHATERSVVVAAMLAGQNDLIANTCCDGFRAELTPIKKSHGAKIVMPIAVGYGQAGIMVNLRRAPFGPLDDPTARTIRKAIQLWYDRDESGEAGYQGMYMKPYYYYPGCAHCELPGFDWIYTPEQWEEFPGFNPDTKEADIAEAKRLMESIGYGPDNMLEFDLAVTSGGSTRRQADAAIPKMADIYLKPNVRVSQVGQGEMGEDTTQMVFFVRGFGLLDPQQYDDQLYLPFEIYNNSNWNRYDSAEYLRLHTLAATTVDQAERGRLYREIVDVLYEDAGIMPSSRATPIHPFNGAWRGWTPKTRHVQNSSIENVWIHPSGEASQEVLEQYDVYTRFPDRFPL